MLLAEGRCKGKGEGEKERDELRRAGFRGAGHLLRPVPEMIIVVIIGSQRCRKYHLISMTRKFSFPEQA